MAGCATHQQGHLSIMECISTMGSGSLGRELDLESLTEALRTELGDSLEVNFHSSGMVTLRLEHGGPAYTIYRTGTFQIRGPKDKQSLYDAEKRFLSVLGDIGVDAPDFTFDQRTAVFIEDVDNVIDLETLAITLGLDNIEYEPEQFPGLVYRNPDSNVTLLVFASGKVIVSGITEQSEAEKAIKELKDRLP